MSLKKLWQLQKLKNEHINLKNEYDNSFIIQELKRLKQLITEKRDELKVLENEKKEIEKSARKNQMKEADLEDKIGKIKEKLYGGSVSSPKELSSLEKQLNEMNTEKQKTVEEYIENSMQLEEMNEKITNLKNELQEQKESYDSLYSELQDFKEECQGKINKIATEYNELKSDLDPKLIREYNRLYDRFKGSAIARINSEGECSGCHVGVPSILQEKVVKSQLLVKCESCGRILFNDRKK